VGSQAGLRGALAGMTDDKGFAFSKLSERRQVDGSGAGPRVGIGWAGGGQGGRGSVEGVVAPYHVRAFRTEGDTLEVRRQNGRAWST